MLLERYGGASDEPAAASYDALYRGFGPPAGRLVRLLMRMGCEREEACDIAQEALGRLAARFGEVPNPEAWVTAAATNLYVSRCRHLKMRARKHAALAFRPPSADHGTAVADQLAVAACLARLRPVQRAILILRYFEGYKLREIAEALGQPEGTVKYWGLQAEAILRRALDDRP